MGNILCLKTTGEHIYRVKENAPQRAKDSYELWLKHQELRYTEEELMGG